MKKPASELLLIDVGNTRTKWATSDARGKIHLAGDIPTKDVTTKWATTLAQKIPRNQVIMASVVPKVGSAFRSAFKERLIEVTSTLPELGFCFHYPKPAELGADRLAAAVAVHARGEFPAIIVACGTATAFTVLDAKGRLCGGAIAPGLEAQLTALLGATSQLPATSMKPPRSALGKSTQDAIRAGVMISFQGGVKEIIEQLGEALPARVELHVFLTGGNARHLVEQLQTPFKLRPLLVFEGLHIIGSRRLMPT
jgi:type III pantothenate kinase